MRILVDPHIAQTVVGCFDEFGKVVSLYGVPLDIQPYVRGDWLITQSGDLASKWLDANEKGRCVRVGVTPRPPRHTRCHFVGTFAQAYRLLKGMNVH